MDIHRCVFLKKILGNGVLFNPMSKFYLKSNSATLGKVSTLLSEYIFESLI